TSSPRVVARVKLRPDPQIEQLDAYFVGRSFDVFDGKEWKGSGTAKKARPVVALHDRRGHRAIDQQFELLPGYDSRTLIAVEDPVVFSTAMGMGINGSARTGLVE